MLYWHKGYFAYKYVNRQILHLTKYQGRSTTGKLALGFNGSYTSIMSKDESAILMSTGLKTNEENTIVCKLSTKITTTMQSHVFFY